MVADSQNKSSLSWHSVMDTQKQSVVTKFKVPIRIFHSFIFTDNIVENGSLDIYALGCISFIQFLGSSFVSYLNAFPCHSYIKLYLAIPMLCCVFRLNCSSWCSSWRVQPHILFDAFNQTANNIPGYSSMILSCTSLNAVGCLKLSGYQEHAIQLGSLTNSLLKGCYFIESEFKNVLVYLFDTVCHLTYDLFNNMQIRVSSLAFRCISRST